MQLLDNIERGRRLDLGNGATPTSATALLWLRLELGGDFSEHCRERLVVDQAFLNAILEPALMFIPSRNVWHPLRRSTRALAPPSEPLDQEEPSPDPDALPEPAEFDEEPDIDAWDAADELAAMSDADFLRQLRADVEGVREGLVPSMTDAMRPVIKDRPWGRRHKRRDHYGRAF